MTGRNNMTNTNLKGAGMCHHNYVARERHFDSDVFITQKEAVRAVKGEFGLIPGSMGVRSCTALQR